MLLLMAIQRDEKGARGDQLVGHHAGIKLLSQRWWIPILVDRSFFPIVKTCKTFGFGVERVNRG